MDLRGFNEMSQRQLLLITGMAGSGKTTLSNMLIEKGYKVFTMGEVIRHEVRMHNLSPTRKNLERMAEDIRRHGGNAAVAKKCIPLIIGELNSKVALDGVRSLDEAYAFEEAFNVILVAVHASPETRFNRLKDRKRKDDPSDIKTFRSRDRNELGFGIGEAVAMSNFVIINENGLSDLEKSLDKLLEKLQDFDKH
jgi:dephospho-CoA kinase